MEVDVRDRIGVGGSDYTTSKYRTSQFVLEFHYGMVRQYQLSGLETQDAEQNEIDVDADIFPRVECLERHQYETCDNKDLSKPSHVLARGRHSV